MDKATVKTTYIVISGEGCGEGTSRKVRATDRVAAKEHAAMTGISLKIFDAAIWPEDEDIYEHPRAGVLTALLVG